MVFKCNYCGREYEINDVKKVGINLLCPEDGNELESILYSQDDFNKHFGLKSELFNDLVFKLIDKGPVETFNYIKTISNEDAYIIGIIVSSILYERYIKSNSIINLRNVSILSLDDIIMDLLKKLDDKGD